MDSVIIKKITEISAIRAIARVRTMTGKTLNMPVRSSRPSASYEGEAETGTDSASNYSNETITPFRLTYTTPITMDMLMDAAFNMESELLADAAEEFAYKEGLKFILGTGDKQPQGFLADTRLTDTFLESAGSGALVAADIINVTGQLKTGYNPTFVMNRRTLATLRTEQSTTGQFIWQPGINGVVQNTIAGEPYVIANDMPDIASGAFAVAYGDFLRGYTIADRTGMSVIRDEFTAKRQAIVEFTMHKWNTGRVTLPEALTGIKIKA
jgi:HK97 family phage major capsid protein